MRFHLPLLIAALSLAVPADAATRNFGITGFEKVRVDGPFKVRLATGVAPYARASGSPAALDSISIEVQGSTLVVHRNQSGWGGYPGQDSGPVEVSIGTHDLSSAWVNDSGTLAVDRVKGLIFDLSVLGSGSAAIDQADVDQLRVGLAGSASAALGGRVGKLTAVIRGISTLQAGNLIVKDATIGAEGAATVAANVTNSAAVEGSGPATVTLTGAPSCKVRLTGSANVSGCRQ